jgi:hypothetical protein
MDTMRDTSSRVNAIGPLVRLLAVLGCLAQAGCMSPLTSLAMREALDASFASISDSGHAAQGRRHAGAEDDDRPSAEEAARSVDAGPPPKTMSLEEAVDRAVARLAHVGPLDAATQSTLLSMLESTKPEDWPAAIDAFAAALEANRPPVAKRPAAAPAQDDPLLFPAQAIDQPPAEKVVAAKPPVVEPLVLEPAAAPVAAPIEPAAVEPTVIPVASVQPAMVVPAVIAPLAGEPEHDEPADLPSPTPPPSLKVKNPCFVSRVRAWGVVDRFEQQVFRPGQEVIVYFELDDLSSRESAEGHATSIDSLFRLVGSDGRQVGQWTFEPIEETCHSPRRDYFARYFLRIPDNAPPGLCRLDFVVTDRLAGISTQSHLDLEVQP